MAFLKVHHVTHRVHDVKQMRAYLEKNFGMLPTLEGRSETQTRFDYIAYKVGETLMDFISPVGDSGLARELKENGPGISHVAYAVDGIENLFDEMRDKGSKIKRDAIVKSPKGYIRFDIDPEDACGVNFQLAEGEPPWTWDDYQEADEKVERS